MGPLKSNGHSLCASGSGDQTRQAVRMAVTQGPRYPARIVNQHRHISVLLVPKNSMQLTCNSGGLRGSLVHPTW
jgi:hypothetical protein